MINIIREDCSLNDDLREFPKANLTVAVFGTQSSGKSTLLNTVFSTRFPVLDTSITRERCTKGVWMQQVAGINLVDTEGFDSSEREPGEQLFQKKVALFCLAVADVLIVNLWMNEVGRYGASHSHILKAIVRASEQLVAAQAKKIIFVVRDCTPDADRSILREDLNAHMQVIMRQEGKKSTPRFNLEYFMMSHYYQEEQAFRKEAKDLLKTISAVRKSTLSNYSGQDRLVYLRKLWEKICSEEGEINLRTVEDVLRDYTLERIRRESIEYLQGWLDEIEDLSRFKTYSRLKQGTAKEAKNYFLTRKPKHLKQNEVQNYIDSICMSVQSRQNKIFMTILLPREEDRLIAQDYEGRLDSLEPKNKQNFKMKMDSYRREIEEAYRNIVRGLRQHAKMTRRFQEKIESKNEKYQQLLEHIDSLFLIELEKVLNQQIDRQTQKLQFDQQRVRKVIKSVEQAHQTDSSSVLSAVWDKVVSRTSNSTVIQRIKSEGEPFSTASLGFFLGSQTQTIVNYYRRLEAKATSYLSNLVNFNCGSDEETTMSLEKFEHVQRSIKTLMEQKLLQESRRFKITLIFVGLLMYLFYSEFRLVLKVFGMGKRRLRRWIWLYVSIMLSIFGTIIYRNRSYFKKFIEPSQ